jgi:hypothetical protein
MRELANCQRSYWRIAGVIDAGKVGDLYCPVSMTPVMHDVTGVNDAGKECIAGVVDTGDIMYHWHR